MMHGKDRISSMQSTYMSQDADTLRAKLDTLLRIAKNNEQKQANFQDYELALLNSSGIQELFAIILQQHRERFQLSEVTLLLLDPEYEFQRLLDINPELTKWREHLIFTDSEKMISQYFSVQKKPRLSPFSAHSHQVLFPNSNNIQSVAILPLIRQNRFIGCLNLGSRSPSRFRHDMGTQFLQHLAAVMSACIENARLQENIEQTGLLDPLTGINNRRFFDQRVEEEVMLAHRHGKPLACLFIDLDHFKRVNDNYGHQAGDSVLKRIAELLDDAMRTSDVLARYGGEEFVILLADTPKEVAYDIAERIRKTIHDQPFIIGPKKTLDLTTSIGLSVLSRDSQIKTSRDLIKAADQAVYAAKVSGRNRVHYAN
jgi:diguanylate cyclase (GGDEF)-like protein